MTETFKKTIFDSIHGFIPLTQIEDRIVNSPYFQRLRWIKQLGWSHYIFPGASHTRFSHALGVMFVMDKILRSIGKHVDDTKLFDPKAKDSATLFHRKMRLAAMLHDIGTFPFSHSIEQGYIAHYKKQLFKGKSVSPANHEELGSFILNNTDFEGGITHILKSGGFDPHEIAQIIRGKSDEMLANQLLHSDIDADRMDYLLRDSHYTGIKYGVFDLDYLIGNMRTVKQGRHEVLAVNESAMTIVEYFLISRYSWYTQIIHEGTGYKFDMLAARVAEFFIETGLAYSFEELKQLAKTNPTAFFGFNDSYFTAKLHESLEINALHPNLNSRLNSNSNLNLRLSSKVRADSNSESKSNSKSNSKAKADSDSKSKLNQNLKTNLNSNLSLHLSSRSHSSSKSSLRSNSKNDAPKTTSKLSAQVSEMIEMLMFRIPLKQIKSDPFESSLIQNGNERQALIDNIHEAVEWLREKLKNVSNGWVIEDIPTKDVIFTKNQEALKKQARSGGAGGNGNGHGSNHVSSSGHSRSHGHSGHDHDHGNGDVYGQNQESVRIVGRDDNLKLLIDVPNSLIRIIANYQNFIPRVYVSPSTYKYLQSEGILDELKTKFSSHRLTPQKAS